MNGNDPPLYEYLGNHRRRASAEAVHRLRRRIHEGPAPRHSRTTAGSCLTCRRPSGIRNRVGSAGPAEPSLTQRVC